MKRIFFKNLSIVLIVLLGLSSCTKYEDGPKLTVFPAKFRLTGKWKATEIDYGSYRDKDPDSKIEFTKDGKVYLDNSDISSDWEFNDDKTSFIITFPIIGETEYEIQRLTISELWYNFGGATFKMEKY